MGRAEDNKGKGGAWRVGGAKGKAANKRRRGKRRGGAERGEVANRMAGMQREWAGLGEAEGAGLGTWAGLGKSRA